MDFCRVLLTKHLKIPVVYFFIQISWTKAFSRRRFMAETLLSVGVEKLWNLLVRESERFQGVQEQFNELKTDLNMLRCFLEDAEAKKQTSAMVRNTVKEIKEIVYDAEDIVEIFLLKEELGKTSSIRNSVQRFSYDIVKRRGLAFDMKAISKRISKVIRDMLSLGVQQVIVNERYTQSLYKREREMRQTFSSDNGDHLVGLEKNVEQLVGYLAEEDSSQVVSITGMGGIGKTTLARQVFNHETVKNNFAGLAWVCVSQQFTREYVWQTILRKLRPEYKVLEMTEDEVQEELVRLLGTQKTLIVLDDIWREGDWDIIKPMFPQAKGWKVLLTTRNEGVALRAHPKCFTFKPDCLTLEECWKIFRRIAFPRKDTNDLKVDEMEEMGKKMIKRCGGLPLAVKVLGGLLAAQYTLHQWKRIYEHIGSHIVGGTTLNGDNNSLVYYVLSLSFEELPSCLKHCFLYLAHFPEDYLVDVEKLSYYWAAEGILNAESYERTSIRDVADGYIEELVKRNMVVSERDGRTLRYEKCHLHDMMREVCLLKANEENFLQIINGTSTANSESSCKSRRLALHQLDRTFNVEREMNNPKLRSLLVILKDKRTDWMAPDLCFTRLKLMRVLDLSRVQFEGGKLPSSIGNLIHLKYLSLYMAHITHLPSSMRKLKLLLYLNLCVHKRYSIYMPNFLKEMRELTNLFLPVKIHDKVKMELGNLVNLETLENFSTEHGSVKDFQGMTRLKVLSILFNGKGCTMETLSSSLSELKHLENLTIYDDYKLYAPTNDEGFFLDCKNLKQLKLSIYMRRLPDAQRFPSHLTSITLSGCCLEEDPMPILEKLLHLYDVSLLNKSFCGSRMVCSAGGFPQLKKLILSTLYEWHEWIVKEGSMQLLHSLTILNCRKLTELPDGLRFITSLEELDMNTHTLEFWKKLSRGGEEYYKIQHIPRLNIV
ncbi:probable disease resistance protein At1g59620 [Eutrema salsugineum]|uniref:probable disease resistance protein At1g59620 n=1 Tax=Eutrema salsugineum TaxID=72664 RepID=UPI000CED2A9B|nr:probable disease resistance protein At1g59620 [Eutrema salsugineum]